MFETIFEFVFLVHAYSRAGRTCVQYRYDKADEFRVTLFRSFVSLCSGFSDLLMALLVWVVQRRLC